jgi:hypothetical protein
LSDGTEIPPGQAHIICRRVGRHDVFLTRTKKAVVHVVRNCVVRAPQKTHTPLTITVNYGQFWLTENANRAASI